MKKVDYLTFVISRFDHYYDSSNNKSSLYIALNTFILGGITAAYAALHSQIDFKGWIFLLSSILFAFCFLSIFFTILAMMPFLQHGKSANNNSSILYFGGIARHAFPDFKSRISGLDESIIEEELTNQTHCLASGLKVKYHRLKLAGIFLLLQFMTLLPLLILIIKNL